MSERDNDQLFIWLHKAGGNPRMIARAYNLLRRNGIHTVEQARKLDVLEVMDMRGAGFAIADLVERAKQ